MFYTMTLCFIIELQNHLPVIEEFYRMGLKFNVLCVCTSVGCKRLILVFKISDPPSRKMKCIITKTIRLMQSGKLIAVYCKNVIY